MKIGAVIPAQKGASFLLKKGQRLKVIDLEGKQVSDLFCFSAEDTYDGLSSGRSIDYNETIYFTKGHRLYSNFGKPMLSIIEDSCGRHDFLVTPCSQQMFSMIAGKETHRHGCFENLCNAFKHFEVPTAGITTTFNIFMNVPAASDGRIQVLPPLSKSGDSITFHAEMDLLIGLTACSDEQTNNGSCKPIGYEILS